LQVGCRKMDKGKGYEGKGKGQVSRSRSQSGDAPQPQDFALSTMICSVHDFSMTCDARVERARDGSFNTSLSRYESFENVSPLCPWGEYKEVCDLEEEMITFEDGRVSLVGAGDAGDGVFHEFCFRKLHDEAVLIKITNWLGCRDISVPRTIRVWLSHDSDFGCDDLYYRPQLLEFGSAAVLGESIQHIAEILK
jgi:hypothetical protein